MFNLKSELQKTISEMDTFASRASSAIESVIGKHATSSSEIGTAIDSLISDEEAKLNATIAFMHEQFEQKKALLQNFKHAVVSTLDAAKDDLSTLKGNVLAGSFDPAETAIASATHALHSELGPQSNQSVSALSAVPSIVPPQTR